jgi:hypothetical protein
MGERGISSLEGCLYEVRQGLYFFKMRPRGTEVHVVSLELSCTRIW